MRKFRKPFLFTLSLFPIAIIASYFAALMSVSSMEPSLLESAIDQVGSKELVVVVSTIQPVFLTLICGFFGYILAEKTGLMRSFRFEQSKVLRTLIVSLIGGALFSLDAWTFSKWIPQLTGGYEAAGSFDIVSWIASVLYGGICEEVMLRLFFMSLVAFFLWKFFFSKEKAAPTSVLIIGNVLSAVVFAASHLPATLQSFGALTPMIVFRCFLMNGAFGLVFGRLYRKFGI